MYITHTHMVHFKVSCIITGMDTSFGNPRNQKSERARTTRRGARTSPASPMCLGLRSY